MDQQVEALVNKLAEQLVSRGIFLGTAESCTGGWIGQALTSVSGSSRWYEGGVICYSNNIKQSVLHVPGHLLERYGAVSEQAALAMAEGTCKVLRTDASVAVTGIAGPNGGSEEKPVGMVWLAWSINGTTCADCFQFSGSRDEVRKQAVVKALEGLLQRMG